MYICHLVHKRTGAISQCFYLDVDTEREAREYCDTIDFGNSIAIVRRVAENGEIDEEEPRIVVNE